jgi:hypothetical protein
MTTSATELQSSNPCRVDGCHSPVFSTGLCGRHKKQQQRQRAAFITVRPDEEWCPELFVPDLRVRKGRNPKPGIVPLAVAAVTHGYDQDGELERLPKKAKTKHLPKDDRDSRVDAWGQAGKQANKTRRKNIAQEYKAVHYAERDRALFLGKQKLPRTPHIPTVPLTLNPSGWGKSSPAGNLAGAFTGEGYKVFPRGVSKPCQCRACKASRKARA